MPSFNRETIDNLMKWFDTHRRTMPWRGDIDPYKIWVSEIMLQQTQVATVIPYYQRWMSRFPTLQSLAESDLDTVLKYWEGLGYYTRARNLLHGARYVLSTFNGVFPQTPKEMLSIPGIGDYTAGAILSISFNLPEPAVDGNAIRVVSRLLALKEPSVTRYKKTITSILRDSYHHFEPRWLNQAWMEFGALQCVRNPVCNPCPFLSICKAYAQGTVMLYPTKKPAEPIPVRHGHIFLIDRPGKILLVKRPEKGLLAGLWELPNILADDSNAETFFQDHPIEPIDGSQGRVTHAYSHFKVDYLIQKAFLTSEWSSTYWIDACWAPIAKLSDYPKPKVHIKALKILELSFL